MITLHNIASTLYVQARWRTFNQSVLKLSSYFTFQRRKTRVWLDFFSSPFIYLNKHIGHVKLSDYNLNRRSGIAVQRDYISIVVWKVSRSIKHVLPYKARVESNKKLAVECVARTATNENGVGIHHSLLSHYCSAFEIRQKNQKVSA